MLFLLKNGVFKLQEANESSISIPTKPSYGQTRQQVVAGCLLPSQRTSLCSDQKTEKGARRVHQRCLGRDHAFRSEGAVAVFKAPPQYQALVLQRCYS